MNRALILIGFACALASAQTWHTRAPLPSPRYGGAALVRRDVIYHMGGSVVGGVKTATVYTYDVAHDSWAIGDSMLTARHRFGAVAANGRLYAFGGWGNGGVLLNSAESYNPSTHTWTSIETMPTRRASMFAGTVNGRVYAIGGWNGASAVNAVESYDPTTGHWTQLRPMPVPRGEGVTGNPDNTIVCIGGTTNGADILDRVDRYDPTNDTWYDCTPIPAARFGGASATETHKVYVYGGVGPGATNTHATDWFFENAWNPADSIPSSRRYLAGCCLYPYAYAIGGLDSLMQPTALVEALELPMAIEEEWSRPLPVQPASLVRNRWVNPSSEPGVLCDAMGRAVLSLHPGANDLSRMPSGVYLSVTRDRVGKTTGVTRITKLE